MSFDGERKIVRRLVTPFLEGAFLLKPVERAVDLNAGKTFRAKPEPSFLRRGAVEIVAPAFVIPTAGTDVRFPGHHCNRINVSLFQFFLGDLTGVFGC